MLVTVVTAKELDDATVLRVHQRMAELFDEEIEIEQKLDPTLLAGIVVYAGGRRFDGSAKGLLESHGDGAKGADIQAMRDMVIDAESISQELNRRISRFSTSPGLRPVGRVLSVGDGIAIVNGLAGCRYNELLDFGDGEFGIAFNLYPDTVGVVLLGDSGNIQADDECVGTGRVVEVPVGEALLGRIIDPLGRAMDGKPAINAVETAPVESPAEEIIARGAVNRPMQTGLMAIDSMVPIGRGQRELIIGDRQTGKTAIAIDAILNQRDENVLCIYVAIGQKISTVVGVYNQLLESGAMDYTTIVCAGASDSAPMQYIAPYSGCAIAEHFMRAGRDVLIVYDDLSKHAQAYRAISLLLRRPPGREAYPGDVFYLHSRLLERAAQLSPERGGGSMTALPIIETMAGDISAYIPTNVISITDGQIFLSADQFNSGERPAVNVGLSVSRVGGSAQTRVMRSISGQLRLELAQYRELAVFSQFGSDLDHATRVRLEQGQRLTEMLKQDQYAPYTVAQQAMLLYAVTCGALDLMDREGIAAFKKAFLPFVASRYPHINSLILYDQPLSEQAKVTIREAVERCLAESANQSETEG